MGGMFPLLTAAFFKALLFLGAASVIQGVEHGYHIVHGHHEEHQEAHADTEHVAATSGHDAHTAQAEHAGEGVTGEQPFDAQDMRNMGGLAKRMPITYMTNLIGTLALQCIFPPPGFCP